MLCIDTDFYTRKFLQKGGIDKPKKVYYNVIQERGGYTMTISLRLNDSDSKLIKAFANMNGRPYRNWYGKPCLSALKTNTT